jgi:iron(III) transport system permease protein
LLCLVAVLVVGWVLVVPLGFLIVFSFRSGNLLSPGGFTLQHYVTALTQPAFAYAIGNTLIVSIGATLLTLLCATLLAWLIERTDMPLRNFGWVLMVLPLAMPGILFAMAWLLLLLPNVGLFNVMLRGVLSAVGLNLESGPLDIRSLWGLIFLDSLRGISTFFFLIVGTLRLMDPALEDAARMSGAGFPSVARRVVLPLLVPGLFAAGIYSLVSSLDSFEAPLAAGVPVNLFVISTLIYFFAYRSSPPNYGLASAYAVVFMLGMLLLVYFYIRAIRRTDRYAVVTGKGFQARRYSLGRWRWIGCVPFALYFLLTVGAPFFILLWASLQPFYAPPSAELLSTLTFRNFQMVVEEQNFIRAVFNTLLLTVSAGVVTMALALVISWVVVRTRHPARFLLDGMTFLSFAIPGVVVAVALIVVYLSPPFNQTRIYGTIWIIVLGVVGQYLAFATRTTNAAVIQIHRELEEAAFTSGATRLRTLARVTMPLVLPSLLAGWIWVAAHAVRTFALPQILHTNQNEVLVWRLWYYWELGNFPQAAALGVLLCLVTFVLAFFSRRLVS